MDFLSKQKETIVAIATPPGEGAISIIRISGKHSFTIAKQIFSKPIENSPSHTIHYGKIVDRDNQPIDTVLLLLMRGPTSYTGEDSVEIHCHGGSLVTRKVFERVLESSARAAEPGEFTLRAFLNKKIDLAQAEAVQSLIGAKTDLALKAAEKQLSGKLSITITHFQKELLSIAAILEAWVDFPEEDLEFIAKEDLIEQLKQLIEKMERLIASFYQGKIFSEGLQLCIVGTPNVGKSSLLNALVGKDRAIVTPIAGTTRDLIEEFVRIGSLPFHVIDTAGIRKTEELVEIEGIKRSKKAIQEADFILLVLDSSRPLDEADKELLFSCPHEKTLVLWNKIDIGIPQEQIPGKEPLSISIKETLGLDTLKEKIENMVWKNGPPSKEELVLTKARHKEALERSKDFCNKVVVGLEENHFPEFLSMDIRAGLQELNSILGLDITEEILSEIFSKFCIGK
ncbi:MAG: tRNA uridine-5-carboxymethylaminomethyl(34) synthesis GTPase MnmE [Chlamydiota bacterium]